jgi:hypothetical protein
MKLTHWFLINHSFTHLLRTSGYHVPFLITTQHWFLPSFLPSFLPWGTAKTLNPACSCLHACLLLCCCTQENPHVSIISWAQSWSQWVYWAPSDVCVPFLTSCAFCILTTLGLLALLLFNSSCAVKLLNPSKFNAHMLKKSGSTFLAPSCT